MRGSICQRYKKGKQGTWTLIFDLGRETVTDPATGQPKHKRRQKWVTFRGTKKQAESRLAELLGKANGGTFVEPSKLTLLDWLRDWLDKNVKPPLRRPETYRGYTSLVETHIASSPLALLPLQRLRAVDLERLYADLDLSPGTIGVLHAVLHRALRKATKERLIERNPADDVEARPRVPGGHDAARLHCWTADEAQTFLTATTTAGPQAAAFYALALETGARKGELCGLRWTDLDLDAARITIARQLSARCTFGPPKNGTPRTLALAEDVVALLGTHKRTQAELKMKNRAAYRDGGLIFARELAHTAHGHQLGEALSPSHFGDREFRRLTKVAGVRRIKFHGLRHTAATLSLRAGVPVHVVAQRLGHKGVEITLSVYAHVLPDMQETAAERLGAVLHGRTTKLTGS
jgi:integrase